MAKAYMSVFSLPANRKRAAKVKEAPLEPNKRRQIVADTVSTGSSSSNSERKSEPEEHNAGDDTDSDTEGMIMDDVDEDKAAHDAATVQESNTAAFSERFGLVIPQSERTAAQKLLPKISGLATRAKKSPIVQHKFEEYVASIPGLSTAPHPALACSVSTRWNTELLSTRSHVHYHPAVQKLTDDRDLSLKKYQLSGIQWGLAEQLSVELQAFERLTLLFSQTQVPLIHQVIPALLKLQDQLQATVLNPAPRLHPLFRVAAQAALKMPATNFEDDKVMCPHKKLEWFRLRQYTEPEIKRIESLAFSTFDDMTSTWNNGDTKPLNWGESAPMAFGQPLVDGWLSDDEAGFDLAPPGQDSLEAYLKAPLVTVETLRRHSSLLSYWTAQRKKMPRVSKFALGILSSPASSVDAERAFSGGRLTINHLQHSMGDTTFEAKMAVGSWYNTPLLPSVDVAAAILGDKVRH
ncbi:hypothetical protein FRC06_006120 [Ceratobasidium sp. 370]|nr:hypothetical protein FRC06_006120 [Ceratobasidium sp. 370]